MKHLDITFDLETCSLDVTAAIMQLGAVAWNRNAKTSDEIFLLDNTDIMNEYFNMGVDMRKEFIAGLDFDPTTANWWQNQREEVKEEMLKPQTLPVDEVISQFTNWVKTLQMRTGAESVTVWSQGADFDCAILRHIASLFHVALPCKFQNFRCARTYAQEVGAMLLDDPLEAARNPYAVYKAIPEYSEEAFPKKALVHDALYDSRRTAWSTWHFMQVFRNESPKQSEI